MLLDVTCNSLVMVSLPDRLEQFYSFDDLSINKGFSLRGFSDNNFVFVVHEINYTLEI